MNFTYQMRRCHFFFFGHTIGFEDKLSLSMHTTGLDPNVRRTLTFELYCIECGRQTGGKKKKKGKHEVDK